MAASKSSDVGVRTRRITTPGGPPGSAPGLTPADPPLITLPAEMIPPRGSQQFTIQSEIDTAAIEEVVFADFFEIPANHDAVVDVVQFFASNADASMAGFAFQMLQGGIPVPGYESLRIPQLGGAQGITIDRAAHRVAPGYKIGGKFFNVIGGAHHVGMLLHGWFWPSIRGV